MLSLSTSEEPRALLVEGRIPHKLSTNGTPITPHGLLWHTFRHLFGARLSTDRRNKRRSKRAITSRLNRQDSLTVSGRQLPAQCRRSTTELTEQVWRGVQDSNPQGREAPIFSRDLHTPMLDSPLVGGGRWPGAHPSGFGSPAASRTPS